MVVRASRFVGYLPILLTPEDMEIIAEDIPGWSVANKDSLTIALDISISDELQHEGNARELVNRIQKLFNELSSGRFGHSSKSKEDMRDLYNLADEVISQFEKVKIKP